MLAGDAQPRREIGGRPCAGRSCRDFQTANVAFWRRLDAKGRDKRGTVGLASESELGADGQGTVDAHFQWVDGCVDASRPTGEAVVAVRDGGKQDTVTIGIAGARGERLDAAVGIGVNGKRAGLTIDLKVRADGLAGIVNAEFELGFVESGCAVGDDGFHGEEHGDTGIDGRILAQEIEPVRIHAANMYRLVAAEGGEEQVLNLREP